MNTTLLSILLLSVTVIFCVLIFQPENHKQNNNIIKFHTGTTTKHKFVRFVEDVSAAKVGDTLSSQLNGDTLDIGYSEDYPNGQKMILQAN